MCRFATVPLNAAFILSQQNSLLPWEVPPEICLGVTAFCARHARVRMWGCTTRVSRALNPHARITSARCCAGRLPADSRHHRPAGSSPRTLCKRDTASGITQGLPQTPKCCTNSRSSRGLAVTLVIVSSLQHNLDTNTSPVLMLELVTRCATASQLLRTVRAAGRIDRLCAIITFIEKIKQMNDQTSGSEHRKINS